MTTSEALGNVPVPVGGGQVAGRAASAAVPAPERTDGQLRRFDLVKRVIDLVLGVVLLVVALPLMLLAALAILVLDGRPVLFRQTRVGRNGRLFTIYKFRTMVPDAENLLIDLRDQNERHGPLFKLTADPRVTRVGRLLRESSLDELPQLFNVLAGAMSLVGPRPALPDETVQFDEAFLVRNQVRPGITGLWQVHARDESSFENYQRLDLTYVRRRSLRLDLLILLKTAPTVVLRTYDRLVASREGAGDRPAAPVVDLTAPGVALAPVRLHGERAS